MAITNTIGTSTLSTFWRSKYRESSLQSALRQMLIAEKVCSVDRTDNKYIYNPYGSTPTTVIQALTGTYDVAAYTSTDDTLSVTDEFIVGNHIYDFESTLSNFDLFASRQDELNASVATAIDKWVLNALCEDGSGTYSTPSGGFTTAANLNVIMSNLISKVSGYVDAYKGMFLVLENTDITGVIQAQATNGFSYADSALNNGFLTSYMGVDFYVTRTGTFDNTARGTRSDTNSGHRVFGVKGVATYAAPRGIRYEEKMVSGKTGREVVCYGYIGFKLWYTKTDLVVDITLTA
jgi:hypothetical protein